MVTVSQLPCRIWLPACLSKNSTSWFLCINVSYYFCFIVRRGGLGNRPVCGDGVAGVVGIII